MCFGANLLKLDKAAMLEMGLRIITEEVTLHKLNVYSIRAKDRSFGQEYTTKDSILFYKKTRLIGHIWRKSTLLKIVYCPRPRQSSELLFLVLVQSNLSKRKKLGDIVSYNLYIVCYDLNMCPQSMPTVRRTG